MLVVLAIIVSLITIDVLLIVIVVLDGSWVTVFISIWGELTATWLPL